MLTKGATHFIFKTSKPTKSEAVWPGLLGLQGAGHCNFCQSQWQLHYPRELQLPFSLFFSSHSRIRQQSPEDGKRETTRTPLSLTLLYSIQDFQH